MILTLLVLGILTFISIVIMIDGSNIGYSLHDDCKMDLPEAPSHDIIKEFKAFKVFTWRKESG